ncbi:MAG TPA: PDZ domain-containing protein [Acidobacteriaceae bacterium]
MRALPASTPSRTYSSTHRWNRALALAGLLLSLSPAAFPQAVRPPDLSPQTLADLFPPPPVNAAPPRPHPGPQPGYLGVSLADLDPQTASQLRLKDAHGSLILSIDRDAPAASSGLRPRDVILEMDGQRIADTEQLRHKLHERTAGMAITVRISRDGSEQIVSIQLGDQALIAERAWEQHFNTRGSDQLNVADTPGVGTAAPAPAASFVAPSGHTRGSGFLGVFSVNALYTGAELDPLSTQLAEYFGVHDGAGLLVRSVNDNSPASAAGLKAGDVILRVNNQAVVSRVDWTKQLHANRGHAIQLSVMRNRHEQLLTLAAPGSAKKG